MLMGQVAQVKVLLCLQPTDMRKSFYTLSALVEEILDQNPLNGYWFVFRNKAGDRVKILSWDGSGYALYYKRLETGTFYWPSVEYRGAKSLSLSSAELGLLIEGIDWRRLPMREEVTLKIKT